MGVVGEKGGGGGARSRSCHAGKKRCGVLEGSRLVETERGNMKEKEK